MIQRISGIYRIQRIWSVKKLRVFSELCWFDSRRLHHCIFVRLRVLDDLVCNGCNAGVLALRRNAFTIAGK
jgi:hypothetical protein